MSVEDKLEVIGDLFYESIEKAKLYGETYKGVESHYSRYQEVHEKFQEYIWYNQIETGIRHINEIYKKYKND